MRCITSMGIKIFTIDVAGQCVVHIKCDRLSDVGISLGNGPGSTIKSPLESVSSLSVPRYALN